MHDRARGRLEIDRRDPAIVRQVDADDGVAVLIRAVLRHRDRIRQVQLHVGHAERPSAREDRRPRRFSEIAARHVRVDPLGEGRDLLVGQPALVAELREAVGARRVPRRHVAARDHVDDRLAVLADLVERNERKRRGLSRPMAHGAVRVDDRRDVVGKRRRGRCDGSRALGSGGDAAEPGGRDDRHERQRGPRVHLMFRSMKQPMALVTAVVTGRPASTASSASRRS